MTVLDGQGRAARCNPCWRAQELGPPPEPVLSFVSVRPRFVPFLLGALALLACAGRPEPKAENHACFRALDCQEGLVCVEGRCTADLTPIVPEASAAAPAPAPPPAGDAGAE
jgi:hypothetical protein